MLNFIEIKISNAQIKFIAILLLLATLPANVFSQTFTCPTTAAYKLQDATCYGSDDAIIRIRPNLLDGNPPPYIEIFVTDFSGDLILSIPLSNSYISDVFIDVTNLDPVFSPYNVEIKYWELTPTGELGTLWCSYEYAIELTQPPCTIEFTEFSIDLDPCSPSFGQYSAGVSGNACWWDGGRYFINNNLIPFTAWGLWSGDTLPPFTYNSSISGATIWSWGVKPGDTVQFLASNGNGTYSNDLDYSDSCYTLSDIIQIPCDIAIEELVTVDNFCQQVELNGRVNSAYMCSYLNLADISNWTITAYDLDGSYLSANVINADSTFYIPNLVDTNSQVKLVWQLGENCRTEKIVTIPPSQLNSAPVASSTVFCQGQTVTLSNPQAPDVSYIWLDANFQIVSLGTIEYEATEPGIYYSVVYIQNCADTASITLTAEPPIIVEEAASFCTGTSFTLPDGNTTETGGVYSYQYSTAEGCDSIYTLNLTEEICTGLTNSAIAGIEIYPNPSSGILHISNIPQGSQIKLINALGQVLVNMDAADAQTTLDVSNIANGIYTISLDADGIVVTRKMVIEK